MTKGEIKKFILDCISQRRGDDLYQAKREFQNFTPDQMNEPYGASTSTRQEILDGYQKHWNNCDEAKKFIEQL